jgi:predicted nucleic acid-binding Zn ribbon protein
MWPCPGSPAEDKAARNPLEKVLKDVIKDLSGKERFGEEEIAGAWEAAVGAAAAKHSRPVSFKKATVTVNVDRSGWLYELTVQKKEILKKLEERLGAKKIKDIRLRIGEIK